jgi:hypothetical protein
MNIATPAADATALPSWLALEHLTPFDAYAQAVGTVMLVIALLQWLCSRYTDARALRIFALHLLTGFGWLLAHPVPMAAPRTCPDSGHGGGAAAGHERLGLYGFSTGARRADACPGTLATGVGLLADSRPARRGRCTA